MNADCVCLTRDIIRYTRRIHWMHKISPDLEWNIFIGRSVYVVMNFDTEKANAMA